jgi:hypothetical protein
MRDTLILIAALSLGAAPASADPNLHKTCKWERDLKTVLGDADLYPGGVVEECSVNSGPPVLNTLYDAPRKDALGLCTIREQAITLKPTPSGAYVRPQDDPLSDIDVMVLVQPSTSAQCPGPKDGGYVLDTNVPDGAFLELMRVWRAAKADPSSLDALASGVPAGQKSWIEKLKTDLTDPSTAKELAVTAVSANTDDFPRVGEPRRAITYRMLVRYANDFDDWYEIDFDWDDGALRIVAIAMAAD